LNITTCPVASLAQANALSPTRPSLLSAPVSVGVVCDSHFIVAILPALFSFAILLSPSVAASFLLVVAAFVGASDFLCCRSHRCSLRRVVVVVAVTTTPLETSEMFLLG